MSVPLQLQLELAPAGGWLRDGEPWVPEQPFYALLGDPIEHSLSPALHNAALRERDLAGEYLAARVPRGRLHELKSGDWPSGLAGANVTSPLKEEAALLCDGLTDTARELGAVNTIRVDRTHWLGHNTDSGGIWAVLTEAWSGAEPPAAAVLLGAGGAARAAVHALVRWGVGRIVVCNRSPTGRERFGSWLASAEWLPAGPDISVVDLKRHAGPPPSEPTVWIVCLASGVDARPFLPDAATTPDALLLDLRYGRALPPGEPPLGLRAIDGKPVLLLQGGLAFAWWFGPPLPWSAMSRALVDTESEAEAYGQS